MNAYKAHHTIVEFYKSYIDSFLNIKDLQLKKTVKAAFEKNEFLPEPLIQFNPSYARSESLDDLINQGGIDPNLKAIFGSFRLYRHQVEALKIGVQDRGFVVTSGTGSGKSLTYLATIFHHILSASDRKVKGVKAILVYPMNALINSQEEEIAKYACNYLSHYLSNQQRLKELEAENQNKKDLIKALEKETGKRFPVTFQKYTGQEGQEQRDKTKEEEPDIILTNYMMLELIMTRHNDDWLRRSIQKNLQFLIFDELHTYRGRQGADVSMLIRRIQNLAEKELVCIGTSATMSTEGSAEDRKSTVAKVASKIFGKPFGPSQIIGEYFETCTHFSGILPDASELRICIEEGIPFDSDASLFFVHPLAIWVENAIALDYSEKSIPKRGIPLTLSEITQKLAEDTKLNENICQRILLDFLRWLEKLNAEGGKLSPPKSYLPFKFHQFISQAGTLYVTLDDREKRYASLKTERYIINENKEERLLFPVLFSRHSGYDFICVTLDFKHNIIKPRDPESLPKQVKRDDIKGDKETGKPKQKLKEPDFPGGYIILPLEGEPDIWNDQDIEYLPDSWVDKNGNPDNFYRYRIPRKLYFNREGRFSFEHDPSLGLWGWFMPAKLLFDPTAGIVYDLKTKEYTKLMRLGNEGRSTATTLLSFGVLNTLFKQNEKPKNQKLLSFTDNRQDASLQSGHFNDFIATAQLRSAIFHALEKAEGQYLDYGNITEKVAAALALPEQEYAVNPSDLEGWEDEENVRALKDYLLIRIIYDLERGWRYNLPNLEQCGLLQIQYKQLNEFCAVDTYWESIPLLNRLSKEDRVHICIQFLDYIRTSYALDHRFLTTERQELESRLKSKLDSNSSWSLDRNERIKAPFSVVVRKPKKLPKRVYVKTLGSRSYVGKYFKRIFTTFKETPMKGQDHDDFVESLCSLLTKGHFLKKTEVKGRDETVSGYRLRLDKVLWVLGDGKSVRSDEVRIAAYKGHQEEPNLFFKDFYQQDFGRFNKPIIGREHTGQLSSDDRIQREEEFRKGKISSLFCSPTMELGIDIAELNIVHMRNVPPTPANYAQRSGRAGRSGQAALVFTYCSSFSPHDRNYFENRQQMVSGIVVPPQIDLVNEELILSHMNAYFLMELRLTDLRHKVPEILDLSDNPSFPIKGETRNYIENQLANYIDDWIVKFKEILQSIYPDLERSYWFTESWLERNAKTFLDRFENSFERWRLLYKSADKMIERSRMILDDPTIKKTGEAYNSAKREHRIGLSRRESLYNDNKYTFGSKSEFYVFRYLASEGFLPGYNFTRLPIRSYLGHRASSDGEYISRPRFIAIREFGPSNIIYHNGNKYRINAMDIEGASLKPESLKVSKETGYAFINDEVDTTNNDPITGKELKGQDKCTVIRNIAQLNECSGIPWQRINSEEEERTKTRYSISNYFNYPKGIEGTQKATIKSSGEPLLTLIYGPSTTLIQHNIKRTVSPEPGFFINKENGKWMGKTEAEEPENAEVKFKLELYTQDTADTLFIQPIEALGLEYEGVVTLAFALKRAIEAQFQVEESEIGVWIMGQKEDSNILIYESAEGSLGILSQLIDNTRRLQALFYKAYEILHFDPVTYSDKSTPENPIPKATYLDLLSYYNQPYHDILDRHLVKEALEYLMECTVDNQRGGNSLDEQYQYLLENYDFNSSTELPLIKHLYQSGIRLPDRAQVVIPDHYVSADFVYKNSNGYTLVFCDGSIHDKREVAEEDRHKRKRLRDAGYDIIEWHHKEPIEDLIKRRKDIFRKIR